MSLLDGLLTGAATDLATSSGVRVNVGDAPAPGGANKILVTTDGTHAAWQDLPSGGNVAEFIRSPFEGTEGAEDLAITHIADGEFLQRVGNEIVGAVPASGGGASPITTATEWYVLSAGAGGNDTNDGSLGAPWATIARVMQEIDNREIQADVVVHLLDVGPHVMPRLAVRAVANGMLQFRGDPSAKTVGATGTFVGNSFDADYAIATSGGLGVDTYKGWFLRLTDGPGVGIELQIASHTEASITVLSDPVGLAGLSGTGFEIFAPTAELSFDAEPYLTDCGGGSVSLWDDDVVPGVVFRNVLITCDSWLRIQNSCLGFSAVHLFTEADIVGNTTRVRMGGFATDPARFGVSSPTNYAIAGAGALFDIDDSWGIILTEGAQLLATVVADYIYVGDTSPASAIFVGVCCESGFEVRDGDVRFDDGLALFLAPLVVREGGRVSSDTRMVFDVSGDDALQVFVGQFTGDGSKMSGGATSGGNVAVRVTLGKFVVATTFAMTGGTTDEDIVVGAGVALPAADLVAAPIFDSTTGAVAYVDSAVLFLAAPAPAPSLAASGTSGARRRRR